MKLSRERQILLAVAGLATLGVMADRFLLSGTMTGPQNAAASVAAPATATPQGSTTANTAAAPLAADVFDEPHTAVESLSQRLERARPQILPSDRNAFATPPAWKPSADAPPTPTAQTFDPQTFVRDNPLEAITLYADRRTAVVAGDLLQLGDTRDGMTLTAIEAGHVVWSGYGVRVRARLHPH